MIKVRGKTDAFLLLIVIVLAIFGVVMVFSASYYSTISADEGPYVYLQRSVSWAVVGFVVMIVTSFIPYKLYYKLAPLIIVFSIIFLLVLFTPLGDTANGAARWIKIGSLTFMPGEFAKLAAIIGCAWYYTKYANQARTFLRGFCAMAILAVLYFFLIYKQPNLSTAIIVAGTIIIMMFISGVPLGYIFGTIVLAVGGTYIMIQNAAGEHLSRITGFLNPFSDPQGEFFQTVQGLIALGSGGLTGVGLGNSVQKALWLPYAQNDFIFAIIGEETGFIGCILVIIAFVVLVWRCMLIAIRSKDRFAMILGSGIAIMFGIQAIMNIGVVTSVLPPTGVTLPFISYGGNAVILFMFLIGIMLNIARKDGPESAAAMRKREKKEAKALMAEQGAETAVSRRRARRREARS